MTTMYELDTIFLTCPKCKRHMSVVRQDHDPETATTLLLDCPECWDGGFYQPIYLDKDGKQV